MNKIIVIGNTQVLLSEIAAISHEVPIYMLQESRWPLEIVMKSMGMIHPFPPQNQFDISPAVDTSIKLLSEAWSEYIIGQTLNGHPQKEQTVPAESTGPFSRPEPPLVRNDRKTVCIWFFNWVHKHYYPLSNGNWHMKAGPAFTDFSIDDLFDIWEKEASIDKCDPKPPTTVEEKPAVTYTEADMKMFCAWAMSEYYKTRGKNEYHLQDWPQCSENAKTIDDLLKKWRHE